MRGKFIIAVNSYKGIYEVTNRSIIKLFFLSAKARWITRAKGFETRYAWCAAFIYHCLCKAGIKLDMEAQYCVRAKSFLPKELGGQLTALTCKDMYDASCGDIMVVMTGKNRYHVTMFNTLLVKNGITYAQGLGGNQNNRVKTSLYSEKSIEEIIDFDSLAKAYNMGMKTN